MSLRVWQAVAIPSVVSFLLVLAEIPSKTWFTSNALSLGAGVAALSLMATAALLGSRWGWVESLLGGLDRVYRAHKWMGIWALAFASYHLVFKADMNAWETASILEVSRHNARLVRQLSFVALMFIVLLALNRKIPYNVWRWWHKLSGPLFVIVILHWLTFDSPIAFREPAGIWLAVLSVLGVAAALHKLFLYPRVANHAEYEVVGVTPGGGAIHVRLRPVGEAVAFRPGQFGFLRMKEDGLREPHPFTLASGNAPGGEGDFLIRGLGDFTKKLVANTQVGMHADIYAPYGRFSRPKGAGREVWIGGGVGISPFVSWLKDEQASGFDQVTLFYFYTPGREFPSTEIMRDMARERGAELVPVPGGPASAEFKQRFADIARESGPDQVEIRFCGPEGLRRVVQEAMKQQGIPERNIEYEYFEFR